MKLSRYSGAFSKVSFTCTLSLTLLTTTVTNVVAQDWIEPPPASPTASNGYVTLSWGSSGAAVGQLQKALKEAGFYQGEIDNFYGYAVQEAVFNFQQASALAPDGIAHPETQSFLYNNDLDWNNGSDNAGNGGNNPDADQESKYIVVVPVKDAQMIYQVQKYAPQAFVAKSGRRQFVLAGAFPSRNEAESLAYFLRSNGFDARVDYR